MNIGTEGRREKSTIHCIWRIKNNAFLFIHTISYYRLDVFKMIIKTDNLKYFNNISYH